MKKSKELYICPACEAIELKLEGMIALSPSGDWFSGEEDWTNS